jgi:hypothetical protein
MFSKKRKPIYPGIRIGVDFDGVLHRYTTKYVSPKVIPDLPYRGAISWLYSMIQFFEVDVLSARAARLSGRRAMRRWLRERAGEELWNDYSMNRGIKNATITCKKRPCIIYLDDRAVPFVGEFPRVDFILNFVPNVPFPNNLVWDANEELKER